MKTEQTFDVIVIGGGHAGIEAAHVAANLGSKTLLLTLDENKIGLMPCNPSIGGLGKGHIVFEVSALGGLMPKICSRTYLQARMLNTSKGPAVQGLRLQIDKHAYSRCMQEALQRTENLTIIDGKAEEVLIDTSSDGTKKVAGVKIGDGRTFRSSSVIVTTGTFLRGVVHIGLKSYDAGRMGEDAAIGLSDSLAKIMGVHMQRLKTGTPPRLLCESVDFSVLARQSSHDLEFLFEFSPIKTREKIPCYIAYTNEKTHDIIRKNLRRSGMYSGNITGVGPRYCPSIEDKIARFPDRTSHHVFVEPEGGDSSELYPAGLSTSLPIEVQEEYIQSIKGFEKAVITKPGYAVEYDFVQPTHLTHSLEATSVQGLFFAGQINGTTGYEEAAGQGIIAGINAHRKNRSEKPFILSRSESYIGVMIDDLVTLGVDEPYRMFTSRAERRLLLRQDNAFIRLMPYAKKLGLVDEETFQACMRESKLIEEAVALIKKEGGSSKLYELFSAVTFDKHLQRKARELLWLACKDGRLKGALHEFSSRVLIGIHSAIKYDGYLDRERKEIEKLQKYQGLELPVHIVYGQVPGLSCELVEKLSKVRPRTIAQAQRIPGMTPAALSLLIFQTKLAERRGCNKSLTARSERHHGHKNDAIG